jgi:Protein of unknown function (DUF4089)
MQVLEMQVLEMRGLEMQVSAEPRSDRAMMNRERTLTIANPDSLDDYIDVVAKALALSVEEAWRPAVRANLEISLRLARLVDEFALPDETEAASVFTA